MEIKRFAVTFGVQYGRKADAEKHPLGMFGDGYAVIEAPDEKIARSMAFAIFSDRWSFMYELEEFLSHERREEWHPGGELLRIVWQTKGQREALEEAAGRVAKSFGLHAPSAEEVKALFGGNSEDVLWPPVGRTENAGGL